MELTREQALSLLQKYNSEPFHILHALTVEGVMRWFAQENGEDADFWGLCGLLHDVDFEQYPDQHCLKAPELLAEVNASEEMVHAICSHGYGLCCDVEPVHLMEKILFAADELTGLIGAAARMRPSKSVQDMELSSLKKKFKDKKFAAGCSREVIKEGAQRLRRSYEEEAEPFSDEFFCIAHENVGVSSGAVDAGHGDRRHFPVFKRRRNKAPGRGKRIRFGREHGRLRVNH